VVRRTLDARPFNAVANHPDVRPWIGGEGPLDLAALVGDPANFALEAEHGGWILARHEPGIYELHTLFLPEGRGRTCLAAWREAERFMFAATDAREIVTRIPAHNAAAAFAARLCGFKERFARRAAFRTAAGELVDVSFQALTLDDWTFRDPAARHAGRVFHAQLEAAKARADSALETHAEDEAHDRAVGAACLMIGAGNPKKGVWAYNRWARLAGYATIALLNDSPITIDVRDAVVGVKDGAMEVLTCRSA
jgi:hypothetical protein